MIVGHLQRGVSSSKKELRKSLIARLAPKATNQGIKGLNILIFLLITRRLIMMRKTYGIENYALLMACITMLFPSVGK